MQNNFTKFYMQYDDTFYQTTLMLFNNSIDNKTIMGGIDSNDLGQKQFSSTFINDNDDDKDLGHVDNDRQAGVLVAPSKPELKKPKMYKVFLLNDDYTTMDFVIMVLQHVFYKTRDEAVQVMLQVHQKGKGVCGTYTKDVAETKVQQVIETAKENGHPLQCIMQPD